MGTQLYKDTQLARQIDGCVLIFVGAMDESQGDMNQQDILRVVPVTVGAVATGFLYFFWLILAVNSRVYLTGDRFLLYE